MALDSAGVGQNFLGLFLVVCHFGWTMTLKNFEQFSVEKCES